MSGPDGMAGFVRARLEDLARTAGTYHADGADFLIRRCRSLDLLGPCDCGEPNRRRRRAFTHRNLVDWAITVNEVASEDGYNINLSYALRHLAAEWSDHPDYLTEWAP